MGEKTNNNAQGMPEEMQKGERSGEAYETGLVVLMTQKHGINNTVGQKANKNARHNPIKSRCLIELPIH